jgi:hypothetical protein
MVVDDVRFQARRELEAAGLSVESAAYLVEDRPPGGWDSIVTKDYLRAELAELRDELRGETASLRSEFKDALATQTRWFVGALLVSQGVVVAAIAAITGA